VGQDLFQQINEFRAGVFLGGRFTGGIYGTLLGGHFTGDFYCAFLALRFINERQRVDN
jgi:hypothetical protein